MTLWRSLLLAAAALALFAMPSPATAGPVYDGKTVTLIVPNSPSGPMSQYARMIAPHLAKHLGAKEVRVENQKGAGGLKGTNNLWNSAPDGMTIAFTNIPTLIIAQFAESPGVKFDASKFVYLGRVASEPRLMVVGSQSKIKTVEDIGKLGRPFVYPSQGTDEDFYTMVTLSDIFDYPLKIVTGYEGDADTALAVLKGDGDGRMTGWQASKAAVGAGDVRIVLILSTKPRPELPKAQYAIDLVKDPKKKDTLEAITTILEMSRSFFGPPNMDAAATKEMRAAITATLNDPELMKEAKAQNRDLDPAPGEDVQAKVARVMPFGKDLTPIFKKALKSIQ